MADQFPGERSMRRAASIASVRRCITRCGHKDRAALVRFNRCYGLVVQALIGGTQKD